ncbi:hypothetical protein V5F41_07690 [Xanthobacter autotrophicus]|uniref:hypothetical protein n=1 Tax=Xanthobacter autotrophicus TaxID=280 RepID=UPI00372C5D61
MGVIAEAVRHMLAAGMSPDAVTDAVAAMEAAMPAEMAASGNSDAVERKRAADRERMRRKREAARGSDDRAISQVSHEVADCRATSAISRDGCDPSLDKMSPTPPKNYSLPSFTPSVPKGTSCPTATGPDLVDGQDDLTAALAEFNRMAAEVGLPTGQVLSRKRRGALKHRLAECGGLEGWRLAMDRVRASPFLRGENDRGWRASLAFFLKPDNIAKLMEGAYDPAPATRRRRGEPRPSHADAFAAALVEHPDSDFGRRARAGGYGSGGNLRGGDAILAGMARVAERQFGRFPQQDDAVVINGAAWELAEDGPAA